MTVKEAARELGVGAGMVYKLMKQRQIAYLQVGGRKLPDDKSLAEYKRKQFFPVKQKERPPYRFRHLKV